MPASRAMLLAGAQLRPSPRPVGLPNCRTPLHFAGRLRRSVLPLAKECPRALPATERNLAARQEAGLESVGDIAEVKYLAARTRNVTSHFHTALGVDDFLQRLEVALWAQGFKYSNSIACVNLCRDEVTNTLKHKIEQVYGASFVINGLGGLLSCGLTGMGAGLSHSPADEVSGGRERYVFFSFPHIAIDAKGVVGNISRPGRAGMSCACGALIKSLGDIKRDGLICSCKPPGVHDAGDVEFSILKQRLARQLEFEGHTDVSVGGLDLVDITKVAERTITRDLELLISHTVDPRMADYAVVTGVQIHSWGVDFEDEEPNLEFVAPINVYTVVKGKTTFLDISKLPGLSPRQIRVLAEWAPILPPSSKHISDSLSSSRLQEIRPPPHAHRLGSSSHAAEAPQLGAPTLISSAAVEVELPAASTWHSTPAPEVYEHAANTEGPRSPPTAHEQQFGTVEPSWPAEVEQLTANAVSNGSGEPPLEGPAAAVQAPEESAHAQAAVPTEQLPPTQQPEQQSVQQQEQRAVHFAVECTVGFGDRVVVVGEAPELGAWDPHAGVELVWGEGDVWTGSTALPSGAGGVLSFKMVKLLNSGEMEWEVGGDRLLPLTGVDAAGVLRASCRFGDPDSLEVSLMQQESLVGDAAAVPLQPETGWGEKQEAALELELQAAQQREKNA